MFKYSTVPNTKEIIIIGAINNNKTILLTKWPMIDQVTYGSGKSWALASPVIIVGCETLHDDLLLGGGIRHTAHRPLLTCINNNIV